MAAVSMIQVQLDVPATIPWQQHTLSPLMSKVSDRAFAELDSRYGQAWCSHVQTMAVKESRQVWFVITAHRDDLVEEVFQTFD